VRTRDPSGGERMSGLRSPDRGCRIHAGGRRTRGRAGVPVPGSRSTYPGRGRSCAGYDNRRADFSPCASGCGPLACGFTSIACGFTPIARGFSLIARGAGKACPTGDGGQAVRKRCGGASRSAFRGPRGTQGTASKRTTPKRTTCRGARGRRRASRPGRIDALEVARAGTLQRALAATASIRAGCDPAGVRPFETSSAAPGNFARAGFT
jgi:hypothetical protein